MSLETEVTRRLKEMSAAAQGIVLNGFDPNAATRDIFGRKSGLAQTKTDEIINREPATQQFRMAFFGKDPESHTALVLLDQIEKEFKDAEGKTVYDMPGRNSKGSGKIVGKLAYRLVQPPPEITPESNFILYSYAGHVLVSALYQDCVEPVEHGLLTLSRNAYSPDQQSLPVSYGVPPRNFSWSEVASFETKRSAIRDLQACLPH